MGDKCYSSTAASKAVSVGATPTSPAMLKEKSMYAYKHHVIPRHEWKRRFGNLVGFNALDNIVWLTLEQHIGAHRRLAEDGSEFDRIAYQRMSGQIGKEEATIQATKLANTGRKHSEEQNKKHSEFMSQFMKGNKFAVGVLPSICKRQKHSEFMKGKRYSLGFKHSESQNIRQSEISKGNQHAKGAKHSEKQNLAKSLRQRGRKRGPYKRITSCQQ